ncbi:hypothetical protein JB92DRAFT_2953457, partial [Gautieria morchelliformis]
MHRGSMYRPCRRHHHFGRPRPERLLPCRNPHKTLPNPIPDYSPEYRPSLRKTRPHGPGRQNGEEQRL